MDQINNEQPPSVVNEIVTETPAVAPVVQTDTVADNAEKVLEFPIFGKAASWDNGKITITLPSDVLSGTREKLIGTPNIDNNNTESQRDWNTVVERGVNLLTMSEMFETSLSRVNSQWRQALEVNGDKLTAKAPSFKDTTNRELNGERATLRVLNQLGIGTMFQVPLYHTGIWITLKAPSEGYLLELNRSMTSDKIQFGRNTYGLALSNTTSYTVDRFVTAALDHMYDTTLDLNTLPDGKTSLKDVISSQDIPSLIWGLACTMFPKGFQYERACLNDPEKCTHVEREILNVMKLQFTDTSALNDWQRIHMSSRRPNSKTYDLVKRYQDELLITSSVKAVVNKGTDTELRFSLRIPTIAAYVDAGYRWISDITEIVESSLTLDDEKSKSTYITRHGQATSMRQYAHWVEKIELPDDNYISSKETIEETLNGLSTDDKIRNEFIEEVVNYINASNISIIAIPSYNCTNCGADQSVDHTNTRFKSLIPLDPIPLFFELFIMKLQRLKTR
jgi:hypothetical protein